MRIYKDFNFIICGPIFGFLQLELRSCLQNITLLFAAPELPAEPAASLCCKLYSLPCGEIIPTVLRLCNQRQPFLLRRPGLKLGLDKCFPSLTHCSHLTTPFAGSPNQLLTGSPVAPTNQKTNDACLWSCCP